MQKKIPVLSFISSDPSFSDTILHQNIFKFIDLFILSLLNVSFYKLTNINCWCFIFASFDSIEKLDINNLNKYFIELSKRYINYLDLINLF